jgi:tellurite resistance protein
MEKQPYPSSTTAADFAGHLNHRDDDVTQALVTAGALVALADGHADEAERDALVNFVDRQGFVPSISQQDIAEAFDNSVRKIRQRGASPVTEALRPLAGLSLASVIVRTAERVAAADRKIHPGELRALKLIRVVMMTLPAKRMLAAVR